MRISIKVFLMELRKLVAYRADFWVNFLGLTFFSLVIAYYLWDSIFEASGKELIKGENLTSILFYYLVAPLLFRIQQGQNIGFLSRDIYEGGLSKYLLYPLTINSFKRSTYLAHSFFFFIQLCALILVFQLLFKSTGVFNFDLVNFILFCLVVFVNCVSYYYLASIFELTAFWFDHVWSLSVMLRFICGFLGGAIIPLVFFPTWSQELLYLTPFPYMIDFPYQTLQGTLSAEKFCYYFLIMIGWLFVFRFLSERVWKQGKLKYTGVGI